MWRDGRGGSGSELWSGSVGEDECRDGMREWQRKYTKMMPKIQMKGVGGLPCHGRANMSSIYGREGGGEIQKKLKSTVNRQF